MHQAAVFDADVDKRAKVGDVGDDAGQHHAHRKVVYAAHIAKFKGLSGTARVESGLFEFLEDVLQRRQAHVALHVPFQVNLLTQFGVFDQIGNAVTEVFGHLFHQGVAFGVHGGVVERMVSVADAEESGTLFERLIAQARHLFQFSPTPERAVFRPVLYDVGCQHGAES